MGYIFTLLPGVLYLIIIRPQMKTRKRFVLLCVSLTADAQTPVLLWAIPCSWLALLTVKAKASPWSHMDGSRTLKGCAVLHKPPYAGLGPGPHFWILQERDCTFVLGFLGLLFGVFLTTVRIANKIFFLSIELQHVLMQLYLPNPTSETCGD